MSGSRVLLILVAIVGVLAVAFILILVSGDSALQTELWKEAAKTILELVLIGVIGTYATFLFNQYATDRQKQLEKRERDAALREAEHKSRVEALNALTTSYWQIKKALHIIGAHRSAKSYGEQMRLIIDYRLELQRLNNEIMASTYALNETDTISNNLSEMDDRLEELLEEWKSKYLGLSQLQKEDETTDDPKKKGVPSQIDALPALNRIKKDRFEALHGPFQRAAGPIRKQLLADLRSPQGR